MKNALLITLTLAALLLTPLLFPGLLPSGEPLGAARHLPWQITRHGDGRTEVFGLSPGHTALGEAAVQLGQTPEIAVIGTRDEAGALEAFFERISLGPLTGRMIVTAELSDERLRIWRQRALKTDHMDSAVLRSTLTPDDHAEALRAPIRALVFVPSARLDDATINARFGPPVERLVTGTGDAAVTHYLYPALGLDIALNAQGKAQLQYVAPADFARRLYAPLTTK